MAADITLDNPAYKPLGISLMAGDPGPSGSKLRPAFCGGYNEPGALWGWGDPDAFPLPTAVPLHSVVFF